MQSNSLLIAILFFLNLTAFQAQNSLIFSPTNPSVRQGITEKFRSSNTTVADISSIYGALVNGDPMLKVSVDGQQLEFMLYENTLLSKDYFTTISSYGENKRVDGISTKTYDGVLRNKSGYITVTVDHDFFSAMMQIGSETYFIEQASTLDRVSSNQELILYNSKDVIRNKKYTCAVDDMDYISPDYEEKLEERQINLCLKVRMAIASDATMVTSLGSVAAVTNHNISVMNNVAFNYRHEFLENIEFEIVTQYISTTFANDPLSPNTASTDHNVVLPAFRTWGNTGGFGTTFDEAQFWTDRDFIGDVIGLAYLSAICGFSRYHILQDYTTDADGLRVLTAHEMGHNFGANHDAGGSSFIMAPSVNNTNTWSGDSKLSVNALIPGFDVSCLTPCTGPVQASFVAAPGAICNSGTVLYKDKSINGSTRSWTFSGGSPASSTDQQPNVSYSSTGTFSATIVANGTSTYSVPNAVIVSGPPPLVTGSCPLPTGTPGNGGIQGVSLADMFSVSGTASDDGSRYVDRSCTNIASLERSTSYTLGIGLGASPSNFEVMRLYIDYNDNGVFESGELVITTGRTGYIGFINFPFVTSSSVVFNQLLRMRIISNLYTIGISGPCINPTVGQVEDFSVIFKSSVPLPLDLTSFIGEQNKSYNDLKWSSKNESNMKRFTIERSRDGKEFTPIGYVTSLNNSVGSNYTFKDNDLTGSAQWYYRLKLEDLSGAFGYSKIVFLSDKGIKLSMDKLVTINTSDRPISFSLTSSSNQKVTIELFDMMGKLQSNYTTQINEGQNSMEFNTINIPKGMYILLVKNNSGEELVNKIFIE